MEQTACVKTHPNWMKLATGTTLGALGSGVMAVPIPGARPVGVSILAGASKFLVDGFPHKECGQIIDIRQ